MFPRFSALYYKKSMEFLSSFVFQKREAFGHFTRIFFPWLVFHTVSSFFFFFFAPYIGIPFFD